MLWTFIILLIAFILYNIYKERKEYFESEVVNDGTMLTKYDLLISYFTQHPASKIMQDTSNNIIIRSSTMAVYIDDFAGDLEIQLKAELPILGEFSKHWKFHNSYPQDKMIEEIENFLHMKMEGFNEIIKNKNADHKDLVKDTSVFSIGFSDNLPVTEEITYKEVFTIEEFLTQTGAKGIEVKADPKSINEMTGKNNLFMVFGEQTGAVSTEIQRKYYEEGVRPHMPMIGLSEGKDGKALYTLFDLNIEDNTYEFDLT